MPPQLLVGLVLVVGAPALKPKSTPTLVGEWTLESIVSEQQSLPFRATTMVFHPDGTINKHFDGKASRTGTYTVNSSPNPAELDWSEDDCKDVRHAIWKVNGDTLIICNNTLAGEARPTTFTSPAGSCWFLLKYKRVKK